ncbi:MAG: glycine cleavage T C-terminal barrel domain-containing protein [Bryobacteraceae bacterium]
MNTAAYQALRNGAAWIDLSGRGKIRASGEDRARLLHAMTTNHVQQLQPGQGCYAFFLSAQGRILSDVNLFCLPEYFLLDTEPETRRKVFEHLDKFIIADDVTLDDVTESLATVNVEGPLAEQILRSLGAPVPASAWGIEAWDNRWVAAVNSTGSAGFSIFVPAQERAALIAQLEGAGAVEADAAAVEVVRLEHGKPRYGVDITESQIPQETQQMQALHFSKGCYLGQEIVERVRSRGHVNKVLTSLEIEGEEVPAAGVKLQFAGKDAGEISSAAFSPVRGKVVALAVVRVDALAGKELTVLGAAAGQPPI